MGFVTPRMSLKVWNTTSDPYDHEQLADNFIKLDIHDHSQGRGSQIPGAGIQPGAITAVHIYPGSIGGDALAENSVDGDSLVDESVTNQQLAPDARIPVGTVLDWYCADPANYTTFVPNGWVVCDGSVVLAGEHEIPGVDPAASFTTPNLVNKVTLGADPAKALNAADGGGAVTPGVGTTGGSNTVNAQHTHALTVSGNLSPHTHDFLSPVVGVPPGTFGPALLDLDGDAWQDVPNFGSTYTADATVAVADRSSSETVAGAVNTTAYKVTTSNNTTTTVSSTGTSGAGGSTTEENRSAFVGLLKIMKVKNV